MLSEVREWLAEKPLVEYDGASGSSAEVTKTDTSLAGFLLKAAIENLYADRLIDMLITEAAAIWSKENMVNDFGEVEPIDASCVLRILKSVSEVAAAGLPPELLDQIIEQGRIQYKLEGAKRKTGLLSGTHLKDRFNKRFDQRILPDVPTTLDSETQTVDAGL